MIDSLLKYKSLLNDISEQLNEQGYVVSISSGKTPLLNIGAVSSRSFFGLLGSVEVLDTEACLSLLKDVGLSDE
jgi:hypothetical protein